MDIEVLKIEIQMLVDKEKLYRDNGDQEKANKIAIILKKRKKQLEQLESPIKSEEL